MAIEHFADAAAGEAGAFGVGEQLAGCVRILEGFLDAEVDGFGGE